MIEHVVNERRLLLIIAVAVAVVWPSVGLAQEPLPKLGFRQEPHPTHKFMPYVWASFPEVPGFTCDSWCYESAVDLVTHEMADNGKMILKHRDRNQPHVLYVTTVTPQPGAVEFSARAVVDREKDAAGKLPQRLQNLNLCFQLRRAEGFKGRPEPYPEFVRRCFLFTASGRTFLLDTHRRPSLHRFDADDPKNNPPWVQMYMGVWMPVPGVQGKGWAEYSTDRYTVPVIGTVSRDGKHLVAIANGSADSLCNAWHDCLHNNPQWQPADAPPGEQCWRMKVYVMPNDPEALLARVAKDFPEGMLLQKGRVAKE